MTAPNDPHRTIDRAPAQRGKSIVAVLLGFLTVFILSFATDEVLHVLHVYPPWGVPMVAASLNLLALAYRLVFTVLGGYVTARLAPGNPMRLVWILAWVGLVFGAIGVVVAITHPDIGPSWYPIALAILSFPSVLLGGYLWRGSQRTR
jgi:inner membrane protein involved in colicin E2 resistance